ncbi:MAG TPA: CpsB/CapC family capsule biosynthesis tyrosine phosphatase [Solirubrobacteraceae bacterium]|nr:CpsB/CapC family capsule biosynthesis tyrosine phosphatase [Solirubrobacteraceae bacterium]
MHPSVSVAVDLHCHLLPGVDDGARDLDDAVEMARQAQADGIAAVCATPHIRHDHDVAIEELPERLAELSAAVRAAGCDTRILSGGEVAAAVVDELEDDDLTAVTVGGSARWILLEPSPGPLDHRLQTAVLALRARGFCALIAHPERHLAPDLTDRLGDLVALGALVQVTGAALTDAVTQPGMLELARAGVMHVLGSDAHSARAGRPVALSGAIEVLRTVEPMSRHLPWITTEAPRAIVAGRDVRPPF